MSFQKTCMPWNPEIYNQFKNIRYKPFFDLMALDFKNMIFTIMLISGVVPVNKQGSFQKNLILRIFLGIDPSAEMLSQKQGVGDRKSAI